MHSDVPPWDLTLCWAYILLPPFWAINYNATYGRHITKPALSTPSPSARWNLIRLVLCQQPFICHGSYMGSKSHIEQYACENISIVRNVTFVIYKHIFMENYSVVSVYLCFDLPVIINIEMLQCTRYRFNRLQYKMWRIYCMLANNCAIVVTVDI